MNMLEVEAEISLQVLWLRLLFGCLVSCVTIQCLIILIVSLKLWAWDLTMHTVSIEWFTMPGKTMLCAVKVNAHRPTALCSSLSSRAQVMMNTFGCLPFDCPWRFTEPFIGSLTWAAYSILDHMTKLTCQTGERKGNNWPPGEIRHHKPWRWSTA